MSMPCKHFSYSQFDCYRRDPQVFYTRYILGIKEPATPAMMLGSLFHKAAENPNYKWQKPLAKLGYTPDYARGIALALQRLAPLPEQREVKVQLPYHKFDCNGERLQLLGYWDGYNPEEIVEYKTGAPWNQARVDEADQLTFYALMHRLRDGKVPRRIILKHANVQNGNVKTFETRRTVEQIERFRKDQLEPVMTLIDRGVFHNL